MAVRKREWTSVKGTAKAAWIVDYIDAGGKRRQKTFTKKKEADAYSATASVEVRQGTHVADSASITVAKAGDFWIASGRNAGLERSSIGQRQNHLANYIIPAIGEVLMSKLTLPAVREFEDRLRREGTSAAMTKKVLTSLGSIFADATERGLAARNPVREMRGARKGRDRRAERRQRKKIEVGVDLPTREEVRAFLDALDEKWRPLFVTAVFTGMRSSEVRGLRWQDVDFKRSEIRITQRADSYAQIGAPKSEAGSRTIPVPPQVINVLKQHRLRQPQDILLVFGHTKSKPRSHTNIIDHGLKPGMIRAGVVTANGEAKYTGMHALRHFYASWCINRKEDGGLGLPAKMVQERLGHASIVMTMDVYGHLFPRDDDGTELANAASSLLG